MIEDEHPTIENDFWTRYLYRMIDKCVVVMKGCENCIAEDECDVMMAMIDDISCERPLRVREYRIHATQLLNRQQSTKPT